MSTKTINIILGLGFGLLIPCALMAQETIEWQVKDRYRLYEAAPTSLEIKSDDVLSASDKFLDDLGAKINNGADKTQIYKAVKDFLLTPNDNDNDGEISQIFKETHWHGTGIDIDGKAKPTRFYSPEYLYPEYYNISAKLPQKMVETGDLCRWEINDVLIEAKTIDCQKKALIPIKSNGENGTIPSVLKLKQLRNQKTIFETQSKIEFKDQLIVALGDSYASGEGNPDSPHKYGTNEQEKQDFQNAAQDYFENGIDPYERWWAKSRITSKVIPAEWWDGLCHRSLFSQHAIASLIHAAKNPKSAVSYMSFACSGAETFNGILSPQTYTVGQLEIGAPKQEKSDDFKIIPQLEAALSALCKNKLAKSNEKFDFSKFSKRFTNEESVKSGIEKGFSQSELKCEDIVKPRQVDTLLLSIGGNDAGFVEAIINLLLPNNSSGTSKDEFAKFVKETFNVEPTYVSARKVNFLLPTIYNVLDTQLKSGLIDKNTKIIQSQYPNPFMDESGVNYCNGPEDNKLFHAFNSLYLDEKTKSYKRWRTEITEHEGRDVKENLFDPLNKTILKNTDKKWNIASYGNVFEKRGWCAGTEKERSEFSFPALDFNNQWTPFDPKTWDAYAPRTRLFRTVNDTSLTQIGSNKGFPIIDKIFDQDRAVFSTFGMFHPTAEAHTIMGIEVQKQMEK